QVPILYRESGYNRDNSCDSCDSVSLLRPRTWRLKSRKLWSFTARLKPGPCLGKSVIQFLPDLFQCLPARILHRRVAGTWLSIAILAATRTEALAIFTAQHFQRNREQHLLAQDVFQEQAFALIVADLGFRIGHGEFLVSGVGAQRTIQQVKAARDVLLDRI